MKIRIIVETDDGSTYAGETVLGKQRGKPRNVMVHPEKQRPKKMTSVVALNTLWQKSHFKNQLSLAQIKLVLREQLHSNFPDSTLMMALASSKYLTRRGARGSYTWIQKYPYGG